jgi:hypothetical protein
MLPLHQAVNNVAALYHSREDYERALPLYEEALGILRTSLPPNHPTIASSLSNMAALFKGKVRLREREWASHSSLSP